jgi:SAM-dependent methyltransferase
VFAIHGDAARVPLPAAGVDAVLVANTYHELADPAAVLEHAREALRPGGRVVVLDPAAEAAAGGAAHGVHDHVSAETAAAGLRQAGFELVARDDGFVHDQGRSWWLLTARKPLPPSAAGGP